MNPLRNELWRLAGIALAASLSLGASQDVVRMKSGDVVSGKIEKIDDERLTIDPDFSDPISIKLKYIASIETARPVEVTYPDGRTITGFVEVAPDGSMSVRTTPTHAESRLRARLGLPPHPGASIPEREGLELASIARLEPGYSRYDASIELGLNAASGNTQSTALAFDASLEPSWGLNSMRFAGSLDRRSSNGDINADHWQVGLQYERDLVGRWLAYAMNAYESDPFQDLDLRTIVALGGGYKFYDTPSRELTLYLGPSYLRENFAGRASDRNSAGMALSTAFEQDLFSSDFTFYHRDLLLKAIGNSQFIAQTTQ